MEYHSYKHKKLRFGFRYDKCFITPRHKSEREQRGDTRLNTLTTLELRLRGVYADICFIVDNKDAALNWEYYTRLSDEADGLASLISWLKERSEIERVAAYD